MTGSIGSGRVPLSERGFPKLLILGITGIVVLVLVLLGNWQLRRLDWKLALIERAKNRAFAVAVAAPTAAAWTGITRETAEYRRVVVHGQFLHHLETLVWALTDRGNGYWVVTPLLTPAGETVLINRGYVPVSAADPSQREAGLVDGAVTVTGLLRISEPGGIAVRDNDPAADRWYSRDVTAIAQARKLAHVAPYFIDADERSNPGALPIGGLTRLDFRNAHLIYALTWYGLALTLAVLALRSTGLVRSIRERGFAG